MTTVKGWCSANCLSPSGIVAAGTKAVLRKGNSVRNIGVLLAVSTLLAARPSATASQIGACANNMSRPSAAAQPSTPADGLQPSATATPITMTRLTATWIRLARTWPPSTAARAIDIVRNRSTMPLVMSIATTIAVPWTAAR